MERRDWRGDGHSERGASAILWAQGHGGEYYELRSFLLLHVGLLFRICLLWFELLQWPSLFFSALVSFLSWYIHRVFFVVDTFILQSHTWPMLEAFKREHCHSSDDDQPPLPPEVVPVRVRRGGIGIHDGRTWHGTKTFSMHSFHCLR